MADKKLTDEEIIKRLERCVKRGNRNYDTDIVLDLINRLRDEIGVLKEDNRKLSIEVCETLKETATYKTRLIDKDIELKAMRGVANSYKAENKLLKRTPKPPILDIIYPGGIKSYKCPICKEGGLVRMDLYCPKYCPNCGQAIDWSDTK